MSKKSQDKYRAAGMCILCGKVPPRHQKDTCQKCIDRSKAYTKKSREARIATGMCSICGINELVTKRHCYDCKKKHQASTTKNYLILKDEVFSGYGGYKCACCGEEEKVFLSIDHINNNGAEHRKEIGHSLLYKWLKNNNFPSGFQVLCMNCQWGKRNGGICPHQLKREQT